MSPPLSELFEVRAIPNAGRGVIASKNIGANDVVLDSQPPVAHVIFRQYRKEVCAHCFHYNRGRTLAVRDTETGKVFCSEKCQTQWTDQRGQLGLEAWRLLHAFVQNNSKNLIDIYSVAPTSPRPTLESVNTSWQKAALETQHRRADATARAEGLKSRPKPKNSGSHSKVDPDILAYLLSGVLFHHSYEDRWDKEVLALAMDPTPYNSAEDLEAHCSSFLQLSTFLPSTLYPSCSPTVCRMLAEAGSHNAFGIRAGSEDGEEYMGYSLYPAVSYFNHSCDPNIAKRRVGSSWRFRAARNIASGQECCISYLGGDEKDLTVFERRERLEKVWGFECAKLNTKI